METASESPQQKVKRLALSKIVQNLRDIGVIMNKMDVNPQEIDDLKELTQIYFNLNPVFRRLFESVSLDNSLRTSLLGREVIQGEENRLWICQLTREGSKK